MAKRENIMQPLSDPLLERDRLWCVALIAEGTDVIERVTRRFIELRDGTKTEKPLLGPYTMSKGKLIPNEPKNGPYPRNE